MKKNTLIIILSVLIVILGVAVYLTSDEGNNNKQYSKVDQEQTSNNQNTEQEQGNDNQNTEQEQVNNNQNTEQEPANNNQNTEQGQENNNQNTEQEPANNNQNTEQEPANNNQNTEQGQANSETENTPNENEVNDKPVITKNNLVSYNGSLKIKNNTLVNQYGEKVQLKGVSTHGLQWYGEFANEQNMKTLRDEWNSNLFRIAMYTNENGYIQNRNLKEKVKEIVNNAIKLDMYVIIDWHILSDGNPNIYKEEAKEFFREMSTLYKNTPNVIFEICNEPNGNVFWDSDIKPYAEEIINIIRQNSQNIIIVGTGTWSQDIDKASLNPINDNNTMYALHFYSGTHTDWLRNRAKETLNKIPIFVSEWGVSDASGNGGVYLDEAKKWIDFMNENSLSWASWSLSNKNESSALLLPSAPYNNIADQYLSAAGKFIKQNMK